MSVKKLESRGGKYQVRWREGGKQKSRLFDRKGDADAFDLDRRRKQQLGSLAAEVMHTRQTLSEFLVQEYWPKRAIPNLAASTRPNYFDAWQTHIENRLGGYELRELTAPVIDDFIDELAKPKHGLSKDRQLYVVTVLSSVLSYAATRGQIPSNPVRQVQKPKRVKRPVFQPLSPLTVETIRAIMLEPKTRQVSASKPGQRERRAYTAPHGSELERRRNALIVSMLAYAGLRPGEDQKLVWGELEKRTLHVWATKTERERWVDVLEPLALELAEWRILYSREVAIPEQTDLIIPKPTGGAWTKSDWGNWRRRVWRPAAEAAGVTGDLRPYRLRGSFASLLLWAGESLPDVAEQDGHSVATLARYYTGTMKEMKGQPKVPAAQAILDARARVAAGERSGLVAADSL